MALWLRAPPSSPREVKKNPAPALPASSLCATFAPMKTQSLYHRAVAFATEAHQGQRRYDGSDYITHPLRVAASVQGEAAKVVAVLHDVLEDTPTTAADLRAAGIPEPCIEALRLLCHDEAVPYLDYVRGTMGNPLARAVKCADLWDNFSQRHLIPDPEKRFRLASRYAAALELLLPSRPLIARDRRLGMPYPERGRPLPMTFAASVRRQRAWWAYEVSLREAGVREGTPLGDLCALGLHDSPLRVKAVDLRRGRVRLRVVDLAAWEAAAWKGHRDDFAVELTFTGVSNLHWQEPSGERVVEPTIDLAGLTKTSATAFRWVLWVHPSRESAPLSGLALTFRSVEVKRA